MGSQYTPEQDLTLVLADDTTYSCHSAVLSRLDDLATMLNREDMVEVVDGMRRLKLPAQLTYDTVEYVLGTLYRKQQPKLTPEHALRLLEETKTMRSVWKLLARDVSTSLESLRFASGLAGHGFTLFEFYVENELVPLPHIADAVRYALTVQGGQNTYTTSVFGRSAIATFISRVADVQSRYELLGAWMMNARISEITRENVAEVGRAVGIDTNNWNNYRTRLEWLHTCCNPGPMPFGLSIPQLPTAVSPDLKRGAGPSSEQPSKKAK